MSTNHIHRDISIGLLKSTSAFAVRTPRGQKDPGHIGWDPRSNNEDRSRQTIHDLERSNDNVGIHLHGTIVDVDIDTDSPLMLEALDYFLPPTAHVWGRPSRPRTHRLYEIVPPIGYTAYDPQLYPFLATMAKDEDLKVEVRGGNAKSGEYSLLPGSIHPSGEEYAWHDPGAAKSTPSTVSVERLMQSVRFAAVAAVVSPYFTEGVRNELCMSLSGFFHRVYSHMNDIGSVSGIAFEKEDARELLRGIMHVSDDDESDEQMRMRTFEDTWDKGDRGDNIRGATSIAKTTGDDAIVGKLYALLADSPELVELDRFMQRYAIRNNTSNIIDLERAGSRASASIMTVQDFRNSNMHKVMTANGRERISMVNVLLSSARAIRVDGFCFRPDHPEMIKDDEGFWVNNWRGWRIGPCDEVVTQPDIAPFLEYVKTVISNEDADVYEWVLDWIADIFQNPGDKIGTALVMVGKPGSGKSFLGHKILKPIIGRDHYMTTNDISALTGNFNLDSANTLVIQCDEAMNSRRRQDALRLKSMITDSTRRVEPKNVNAYEVEDHTRYIITSNEETDAIAIVDGEDDRRYTVLKVNEAYAFKSHLPKEEKEAYWVPLYEWVEDPSNLAKVHRWLRDREVDRKVIRRPLATKARQTMQQHSQRGLDDWLMRIVAYEHPLENMPEYAQKMEESFVLKKNALVSTVSEWPHYISYRALEESYELYRRRTGAAAYTESYNSQQIKSELIKRKLFKGEPLIKRAAVTVEKNSHGNTVLTTKRVRVTQFPEREAVLAYLQDKYGFETMESLEDFKPGVDDDAPMPDF